jgi:predicted small lipoprotein YifL
VYGPAANGDLALPNRLAGLLILLAVAAALSACGRRTALETPVSIDQTVPWTEDGRRAMNPPRDADGRPERVPSRPQPEPLRRDFPLDPLLN